jgi:4'-phosphopantetheinyl transferase
VDDAGAAIADGEVHVWEARPEDFTDELSVPESLRVLSAEERARHDGFAFDGDRQVFRVAHAMLRDVLGAALDRPPSSLAFVTGPWGRPELADSPPPLRFSLSHTPGLAACALTAHLDVGIDVEDAESRAVDADSVAKTVLAPGEIAALRGLPTPEQRERFLALWTLKESVVKALGRGVSHPLATLSLEIDTEDGDVLKSSVPLGPGTWRLWRWPSSPQHRAALAVRYHGPEAPRLVRHAWRGPNSGRIART